MAEDIDDLVEEDEDLPIDDDDAEPTPEDLADTTVTPEPGLPDVESLQDILAKQEATETTKETVEEDEEVVPVELVRDDRAEPLDATKVVPMQETEFMCKRCYLVKHRSQLADKKKMLCRDCA